MLCFQQCWPLGLGTCSCRPCQEPKGGHWKLEVPQQQAVAVEKNKEIGHFCFSNLECIHSRGKAQSQSPPSHSQNRKASTPLDGNIKAVLKGRIRLWLAACEKAPLHQAPFLLPLRSGANMEETIHLFPVCRESKNWITNASHCSSQLITEWLKLKAGSYSSTVVPNPESFKPSRPPTRSLNSKLKLITIKTCFMKAFPLSAYNYLICLHNIYLYSYLRLPYSTSFVFLLTDCEKK